MPVGQPALDSGRSDILRRGQRPDLNRTGWLDLMSPVQPCDNIVVASLDRFSRNFEEGVRIQAEPTRRAIAIVMVRENIDTTDEGPVAKFFRRSMFAQGARQVESASERIKLGLDRIRAGGKQVGRPPALTPEQVEQCRRMADDGAGLRQIARVMTCSPATVKKALDAVLDGDLIAHTEPPDAALKIQSRL